MGKRDTLENKLIVALLDKVRPIRITMLSLLILEGIYGTVGKAMGALRDADDPKRVYAAIIDFLYATTAGMTKIEAERHLNENNILDVHRGLIDAVIRDFPEADGSDSKPESDNYDWDNLYYIGRYKLLMGDDEFWGCTPKRYWKLFSLWLEEHGAGVENSKELEVNEIPW